MQKITLSAVVRRLALVFCLLLSAVATSTAGAAPFTALYAFGDSLSDLGNTYDVFGGHGADSAIYGLLGYTASPNRYDDGRWTNGQVWVEHLNTQLGLPALAKNKGNQPLSAGTNFAYAGSTSGTGNIFGVINNLQLQLSNYLNLAGGSASSTALYTVWSGGNDVINYVQDAEPNTPAGIDALTTTMAANLDTAISTLYTAALATSSSPTCRRSATNPASSTPSIRTSPTTSSPATTPSSPKSSSTSAPPTTTSSSLPGTSSPNSTQCSPTPPTTASPTKKTPPSPPPAPIPAPSSPIPTNMSSGTAPTPPPPATSSSATSPTKPSSS